MLSVQALLPRKTHRISSDASVGCDAFLKRFLVPILFESRLDRCVTRSSQVLAPQHAPRVPSLVSPASPPQSQDPVKTLLQRLLLPGVLPPQKQQELIEVAHALDPIRLFDQLEQLQQAVFRCITGCSPCVARLPSAPIRLFSMECCTAGTLPAERNIPDPAGGSIPCTANRRGENASWDGDAPTKIPLRGEQILSRVVANPERSSGDIFPLVTAPATRTLSAIAHPHPAAYLQGQVFGWTQECQSTGIV